MNIPSIENMISMHDLRSFTDQKSEYESIISFIESGDFFLQESEPELMISYLFLIEKALKGIGITLGSRQNEKVIKGIWNVLLKFWVDGPKDSEFEGIYPGIS